VVVTAVAAAALVFCGALTVVSVLQRRNIKRIENKILDLEVNVRRQDITLGRQDTTLGQQIGISTRHNTVLKRIVAYLTGTGFDIYKRVDGDHLQVSPFPPITLAPTNPSTPPPTTGDGGGGDF